MVFKITKQEIKRSSTLEKSDLGKYGILCNGSIFIRDTKKEAQELEKIIKEWLNYGNWSFLC